MGALNIAVELYMSMELSERRKLLNPYYVDTYR